MRIKLLFCLFFCFSSNSIKCDVIEGKIFIVRLVSMGMYLGKYLAERAYNHPNLIIACCAAIIFKYAVLDNVLSYLVRTENKKYTLLCTILYYLGARADPQLLLQACKDNNTDLVRQCLRYGANPKKARYYCSGGIVHEGYKGKDYYASAIHLACKHENPEIIDALLNAGADINEKDYHDHVPFCFVASEDFIKDYLLAKLIEGGILFKKTEDFCCYRFYTSSKKYRCPGAILRVIRQLNDDDVASKIIEKIIEDHSLYMYKDDLEDLFLTIYSMNNEEKRNFLIKKEFLILRAHREDIKSMQIFFKHVGQHDDLLFVQTLFGCDGHLLQCKHLSELDWLSVLLKQGCKKISKYFYENSGLAGLTKSEFLHTVVLYSSVCLEHLLNNVSENPIEDLRSENQKNETVFYVGVLEDTIENKNVDTFKCLEQNKQSFLESELQHVIDCSVGSGVDKFVQFCVQNEVNVEDKKYNGSCLIDIAVKKFRSAADNLGENLDQKKTVIKAFLNVLPEESRATYLPSPINSKILLSQ